MKIGRHILTVSAMLVGPAILAVPAISAVATAPHGVGDGARAKRLAAWDQLHAKEAQMRAQNQEIAVKDQEARRVAFASHDKAKIAQLHAQEAKDRELEAANAAQDRAARAALSAEH